jgi:uncharacterized protein (TIGR03435 family)
MPSHNRLTKVLITLAAVPVFAPAQLVKAFDVAAITPHDPNDPGGRADTLPGGRFIGRNLTMRFLFEYAFSVRHFETLGEPSWFDERFDIDAKADGAGELSDAELRLPLQALLADRLNLVTHWETKELPVYDLVIAPGGQKLRASDPDEKPEVIRPSANKVILRKVTLKAVANMLSGNPDIQRSVTDRTDLTGEFDLTLQWAPEPLPGVATPATAAEGPSIFTALIEQLGLKLIAKKGPDRIVVIDHVDRPSEN